MYTWGQITVKDHNRCYYYYYWYHFMDDSNCLQAARSTVTSLIFIITIVLRIDN